MGDEYQSTCDENISNDENHKFNVETDDENKNHNNNTSHNEQANEDSHLGNTNGKDDNSNNAENTSPVRKTSCTTHEEEDVYNNAAKPTSRKKKTSCTCAHPANHPQPSNWHIACIKCNARMRLQRKKSSIWLLNGIFDQYKTFEVKNEQCMDLKVTVHRGEGITKGSKLKDAIDTPDPYIILKIPQSTLNTPKRTTTEDDSINPIWDQTFHFYLHRNPSEPCEMEVSLMDENVLKDQALDTKFFPLDCLEEGIQMDHTFTFKGDSKVFISFLKEKNKETDLRFSMSLCDEEMNYLRKRSPKVFQSMKNLLGDDGPQTETEVPTIGILGSGGGFRAMIGLSGVLQALQDSGILDCTTYLAGLSGSTWCISTLYGQDQHNGVNDNNDDLSNVTKSTENLNLESNHNSSGCLNVEKFKKKLCESVGNNWEWNLLKMPTYLADMFSKYCKGQNVRPLTLVDIFGHLIGDILLGKKKKNNMKLSHLQAPISDGDAPFPLFAGLHATDKASYEFSEWIEFSPYEIGMGKYGTFMKTEHFGSKFFAGKLLKQFDEMPLHALQGIWGSAFTINLKKHLRGETRDSTEETDEFTDEIPSSNDGEDSDSDNDSDDSEGVVEDSAGRRSNIPKKKQSVDIGKRNKPRSRRKNLLVSAMETVGMDSSYWLNTRAVKPGKIYNPFRGLTLRYSFNQNQNIPERDNTDSTDGNLAGNIKYADGCKFQPLREGSKKLSVMDSGFAFNSPYPLLLRPQRGVDIFLSFDFTARKKDQKVDEETFKQLVKAEEWAKERHMPFPPVIEKIKQIELGTEIEECYVFEATSDDCIPVILHFPLVNNKFREYKATEEDEDFSNFPCFGKDSEFSTFKFHYEPKEFNRLSKLMEFNTLLHKNTIIETIKKSIIKKKNGCKLGINEVAKILLWNTKQGKTDL